MNKSMETVKAETVFSYGAFGNGNQGQQNQNQLYTQVDDFPRLVDQIKGPIAQNILDKVVNFNGLISKLLNIIYKAVMFSDSPEVSSLVQNSLDLLLPCIVWRPQLLLKEIYEFENLESLLIRTLLHNSNENVRRSIERTFKIICNEKSSFDNSSNADNPPPKVHILKILLKNLPDIDVKSDYCEEYFNLITYLIKLCQSTFKSGGQEILMQESLNQEANCLLLDLNDPGQMKDSFFLDNGTFSPLNLIKWCVYQLKARPTYEDRYNQYTDKILAGYLQLSQSVLEINHNLKKLTRLSGSDESHNLIKTIFDFLFLLPSMEDQQKQVQSKNKKAQNSSEAHPKCKRKLTRKKAFNLLLTLCQYQEDNFVQLLKELYAFHSQVQKSQKVVKFSDFDNEVGMRSSSGYVGLKNFGCTCYMNALIQQLFMVPDVRKCILESDVNDPDFESNVLYQMKLIFANLQESEKQYYSPDGFTKAFKFYGEPVNVRVQQDTYEFFGMLFDNIECSTKGTPFEKMLQDSVGGIIGNETKSTEEDYPYIGEREENFYAISLDIKNKKTLQEALDLYIKPDHLEGDNKYFCEKHNRKIDAQRRSYLKKLQNTVIIHMKRFEFDYNSMQRLKVNDYCEFPEKINFKPWTKEGIKERERQLKNQGKNQDEEEEAKDGERNSFGSADGFEEGMIMGEVEEEKTDKKAKKKQHKREAAPIDEDLDSCSNNGDEEGDMEGSEDEEMLDDEENMNSMMDTGKYFDQGVIEDFIDIAADEYDELEGQKKTKVSAQKKSQRRAKAVSSETDKKKSQKVGAKPFEFAQQKKRKSQKDNSYYEYQLVGVLVHSGSADAGHYYSFIKERNSIANGRWLEFNDTHVKEFDIKNLGVECFGGKQEFGGAKGGFLDDFTPSDARMFERCRNAYLLFYERVEKIVEESPQLMNLQITKKFINGIESSVYQRIWDENAAFMKLKIFYDQEYFSFAREYIGLYNFENVLSFDPAQSQSYKLRSKLELTNWFIQNSSDIDPKDIRHQFIQKQLEIDKLALQSEEYDIFSPGVGAMTLAQKIQEDPGFYSIKFATILSLDIITKIKDMQSFVQWMQLMDTLFERNDLACVWLIKYFTDNNRLMEELLIETNLFEVRESFAKLLTTAIGVTAKNEEKYMFNTDDILVYFGTTQGEGTIERLSLSKSAVCRFMQVLFSDRMLDGVLRYNWRKFDEYFQVLAAYAQIGYSQARYLIVNQNAIMKLLEFVMNSSPPFTSNKQRMGDGMQGANFTQAVDILSLLICSCFTQGVKLANQYSPYSKYQEEVHHIELNSTIGQFPLLTPQCFTQDLLMKANPNSDSLMRMVVHLCWGDLEVSQFFIDEIMQSIKCRRSLKDIPVHLKILSSLMTMNDLFQKERVDMVFKFEHGHNDNQTLMGGVAVAAARPINLFKILQEQRYQDSEYVLGLLQFFGKVATQSDTTNNVMMMMREHKSEYLDWIPHYLNNLHSQIGQKQFSAELVLSNIDYYKIIFGPSYPTPLDVTDYKKQEIPPKSPPLAQNAAMFGNEQLFTTADDFITGEAHGLVAGGEKTKLLREENVAEENKPLLNTSLGFGAEAGDPQNGSLMERLNDDMFDESNDAKQDELLAENNQINFDNLGDDFDLA